MTHPNPPLTPLRQPVPLWYGWPAPLVPVEQKAWLISDKKGWLYLEKYNTDDWRAKRKEMEHGEA